MCGDVFCLREDLRGRLTVETGGARAARVVLDLDFANAREIKKRTYFSSSST